MNFLLSSILFVIYYMDAFSVGNSRLFSFVNFPKEKAPVHTDRDFLFLTDLLLKLDGADQTTIGG